MLEAAFRQGGAPKLNGHGHSRPRLLPGARLIRIWKTERHEVLVAESGYLWGGRSWGSLSSIARAITGTRRNGPAFFGLRDRRSAVTPSTAKPMRCAIYTRVSSDEGLEQAFNSLDAQREACAAYILSQKHEGWSTLPARYDDGGFSGGSMDRPALRQLLADVRGRQDRCGGRLQGRSADPRAGRLRPHRRHLRCRRGLLRLGDPGLQHHSARWAG